MPKLIGLSISNCIRDVIEGRIALEDVDRIVAGTKCQSRRDWEALTDYYCAVYWKKNPSEATRILNQLRAENRIIQPKLDGLDPQNIARGHWTTL